MTLPVLIVVCLSDTDWLEHCVGRVYSTRSLITVAKITIDSVALFTLPRELVIHTSTVVATLQNILSQLLIHFHQLEMFLLLLELIVLLAVKSSML